MDTYSFIAAMGRIYGRIPTCTPLFGGWALPPLFLVLELTYRCNLRCPFCYLLHPKLDRSSDHGGKELTATEIESVIDQLPPWTLVQLSGGEVLVRTDFSEILRFVLKKRRCHIYTNGTLVTPAHVREWVSMNLSSIAISLEGTVGVHDSLRGDGTFAKAFATIQALAVEKKRQGKRFPLINLKTTITAGNVGQLSDAIGIAEEAGADYCTFQVLNTTRHLGGRSLQTSVDYHTDPPAIDGFPLHSLDRQLQAIERLAATSRVKVRFLPAFSTSAILAHYDNRLNPRDFTCFSPWTVLYVSPYGEVFPCLNFRTGNVREEPLPRIWNNRRYKQFRQAILKNGLFPHCRGCCDLLQKG